MNERLNSRVEEIVEEKVEESLEEGADSEISKIVEQKVEEKLEDQEKTAEKGLDLVDSGDMDRRSFLKMLGLGGAGLGLAASGAAKLNIRDNTDFFGNIDTNGNTITDSTGQPVNINADQLDGKHASDLGSPLANPSNVQTASKQVGSGSSKFSYSSPSESDSDSATLSLSGPGWVLSGTYSMSSSVDPSGGSANTRITANVDGNKYLDDAAVNGTRFISALYFNSSLVIDMNCSTSATYKGDIANASVSATVNYIKT